MNTMYTMVLCVRPFFSVLLHSLLAADYQSYQLHTEKLFGLETQRNHSAERYAQHLINSFVKLVKTNTPKHTNHKCMHSSPNP